MAKAVKLKVYRTPIGFHDAYIAAPSQKAALEAWGADADLFARGVAERVTDPKLIAEPLSRPGVVIKRARGTVAEHIGALPKTVLPKKKTIPRPTSTPRPKPSRASIEKAERALEEHETRYETEEKRLADRERAFAAERRALDQTHRKERQHLQARLDRAKNAYEEALRAWEP